MKIKTTPIIFSFILGIAALAVTSVALGGLSDKWNKFREKHIDSTGTGLISRGVNTTKNLAKDTFDCAGNPVKCAKDFPERAKKELKRTYQHAKEIAESPSTVLDPSKNPMTKDLVLAIGLEKPIKEIRQEQQKFTGKAIEFTGKVVKQAVVPIVEVSNDLSREFIKVKNELEKPLLHVSGELLDEVLGDDSWRIDMGFVEIKSSKSVGTKIQELTDKYHDTLLKGAEKFHKFSESTVKSAGEFLEEFGYFMAISSEGFPSMVGNQVADIANADLSVAISNPHVNRIAQLMTAGPIQYADTKANNKGNDYVQIRNVAVITHPGTNTFLIESKDSIIGHGVNADLGLFNMEVLKAGLRINNILLQGIPKIQVIRDEQTGEENVHLRLYARILYLDIDNLPPSVDSYVAHVLQEKVINGKALVDKNIDEVIDPTFKVSLWGSVTDVARQTFTLNVPYEQAVFRITKNAYSIQVKYKG